MKKVKINWRVLYFAAAYPMLVFLLGEGDWPVSQISDTIQWSFILVYVYSFISNNKNLVSIQKEVAGQKLTTEIITVPFLVYAVQIMVVGIYFFHRAFYMANNDAIGGLTVTVLLMFVIYAIVEEEARPWKTSRRKMRTSAN